MTNKFVRTVLQTLFYGCLSACNASAGATVACQDLIVYPTKEACGRARLEMLKQDPGGGYRCVQCG